VRKCEKKIPQKPVFLASWFSGQNLHHHFRDLGKKTINLILGRPGLDFYGNRQSDRQNLCGGKSQVAETVRLIRSDRLIGSDRPRPHMFRWSEFIQPIQISTCRTLSIGPMSICVKLGSACIESCTSIPMKCYTAISIYLYHYMLYSNIFMCGIHSYILVGT
jgi:hypothetical protein